MKSLQLHYKEQRSVLQERLALKNPMEVPRLNKVVLSVCVSQAVKNPKILKSVERDLTTISGQKAVITKAKKAVSNFKIKKGVALGATVTLRRGRMWSFLERLIHFALPRVRDFRGLSPKGFDGYGNYNMGIKEQIIFPEIDYDKVDAIRGMNISICTRSKNDHEARQLLKQLGFPFRER